jgi:hypothetical protein
MDFGNSISLCGKNRLNQLLLVSHFRVNKPTHQQNAYIKLSILTRQIQQKISSLSNC